jgi:hypothetical protein
MVKWEINIYKFSGCREKERENRNQIGNSDPDNEDIYITKLCSLGDQMSLGSNQPPQGIEDTEANKKWNTITDSIEKWSTITDSIEKWSKEHPASTRNRGHGGQKEMEHSHCEANKKWSTITDSIEKWSKEHPASTRNRGHGGQKEMEHSHCEANKKWSTITESSEKWSTEHPGSTRNR